MTTMEHGSVSAGRGEPLVVLDGVQLPPGNHVLPPDGIHYDRLVAAFQRIFASTVGEICTPDGSAVERHAIGSLLPHGFGPANLGGAG